ncbi:MAG: hemerythrin domain-containing protein [Candidatus Thermoplasmatota archaeon]|nr:hemerythrin domain-containing protein [Candidatus Thermoplasmatota archaeon]
MHESIDAYMTYDHQDTNDRIQLLLSRRDILDRELLYDILRSISRHIFIEESALFPKLPESHKDDVEYLEREHMEIMGLLKSIANSNDEPHIRADLQKLFDILVEHNSFEESFIYDSFSDMDSTELSQVKGIPREWKCRFCY